MTLTAGEKTVVKMLEEERDALPLTFTAAPERERLQARIDAITGVAERRERRAQRDCTVKFDPKRPCKTQGGRKVRILCVLDNPDVNGDSIVGVLSDGDGAEEITTWKSDGTFFSRGNRSLDLVNTDLPPLYEACADGGVDQLVPHDKGITRTRIATATSKYFCELLVAALNARGL